MQDSLLSIRRGIVFATLSAFAWGMAPVYWKQLSHLPLSYVMFARVLFSFLWLSLTPSLTEGSLMDSLKRLFHLHRDWKIHIATSALLGAHWILFVWCVQADRMIEACLGCYMIPLVTLLLGALVLKEQLTKARIFAIASAALGVCFMSFETARFPWVAFALALSFGFYSILRKKTSLSSVRLSQLECLYLIVPFAFLASASETRPILPPADLLLLVGAGALTAVPMILYGHALRCLPMSRVGFYQYISPSLQFLIALFVYGATFSQTKLIGFSFIWVGIAVLLVSMIPKKKADGLTSALAYEI